MANRSITRPSKEELKSAYLKLDTIRKVAELYGVIPATISRWCKKYGIEILPGFNHNMCGENNHQWKKDKPLTYAAYHYRVVAAKGRANHCEECGKNDTEGNYDWANLTGKYEDVSDYKQMCRSCHFRYDGNHNLPNQRKIKKVSNKVVVNNIRKLHNQTMESLP